MPQYRHLSLIKLTSYLDLLGILAGLWVFRRLSGPDKFVLGFLFLVLVVDLIAILEIGFPNTWFYNLAFPLEQVLILGLFFFQSKSRLRNAVLIMLIVSVILTILNLAFVQGLHVFNTYSLSVIGIFVMITSYFVLRKRILSGSFRLGPTSGFQFGNIIYYGISSAVLVSIPALNRMDQEVAQFVFGFNDFGNCLWALSITFGFLWLKRSGK
jgi:hypothetical protein